MPVFFFQIVDPESFPGGGHQDTVTVGNELAGAPTGLLAVSLDNRNHFSVLVFPGAETERAKPEVTPTVGDDRANDALIAVSGYVYDTVLSKKRVSDKDSQQGKNEASCGCFHKQTPLDVAEFLGFSVENS
jgi:hypothetical protein